MGQHLRHHIDLASIEITGHVRVVTADVMLLGTVTAQHAARLHKEFEDADVIWQGTAFLGLQVSQLFIVTEQAIGERIEKAFFQITAGAGLA